MHMEPKRETKWFTAYDAHITQIQEAIKTDQETLNKKWRGKNSHTWQK